MLSCLTPECRKIPPPTPSNPQRPKTRESIPF